MRIQMIFLSTVLVLWLGFSTLVGAQILVSGTNAVWDGGLTAPASTIELEPRVVVEYATGIWDLYFSVPEDVILETEDTPNRIIVEYAIGIFRRPLTAITITSLCWGDLDNSGMVGQRDVEILAAYFGQALMSSGDLDGDLDDDGDSDGADLALLTSEFNKLQCLGP